jgi:GNAT superfamily N-acetyltransferase
MVDVKVVGPAELDFQALVALQRAAFAEVIEKTGAGYLFDVANYRWKYSPPAGGARIALVLDGGEIVAANSMYPLTIRCGKDTVAGWQSCDTATHPKARGKGYFLKCLTALRETLQGETIFFGFPNDNSMPGFIKFGWRHHSDLRARVRVLPGRSPERFRHVARITSYRPSYDEFAAAVAVQSGAHLDRSSGYMDWRYLRHPLHRYESFTWTEDGRLLGLIVLRDVTVNQRSHAVVMELMALDPKVGRGLLRYAAAWASSKGISITLAINNTLGASSLLCGYLPVPMWAMPKRQVLMGAASGAAAERLWQRPWSVQIGDWDGF